MLTNFPVKPWNKYVWIIGYFVYLVVD